MKLQKGSEVEKGVGSLFLRVRGWYGSVKQGDSCGHWQKKTPDPLRVWKSRCLGESVFVPVVMSFRAVLMGPAVS